MPIQALKKKQCLLKYVTVDVVQLNYCKSSPVGAGVPTEAPVNVKQFPNQRQTRRIFRAVLRRFVARVQKVCIHCENSPIATDLIKTPFSILPNGTD